MKQKRFLLTVLSLVLVAAISIAGTFAYLTDRDSKVNVFTVGDVKIELNESFQQGAKLIPGVNIEKIPTVTNKGDNNAWVWLTFSIPSALDNLVQGTETGSNENVIHWNPLGATAEGYVTDARVKTAIASGYLDSSLTAEKILEKNMTWNVFNSIGDGKNAYTETIDGVEYNTYVLLYNKVLEKDETTLPSIHKVFLDAQVDIDPDGNWSKVNNGVVTKLNWNSNTNGAPVIYVSAYGIQAEGFATAKDAYAAYGKQWGDNGSEYAPIPAIVSGADELVEALANGGELFLLKNISADTHTISEGVKVDINLQDNTLSGIVNNKGEMNVSGGKMEGTYIQNNGEAIFNNVEMKAGSSTNYANISREDAVTVYNEVTINSAGGGVGAAGGAKVIFNSGSVYVDTASTSGRYVFYAEGTGSEITINGGDFSWDKNDNQKRAYIYAGTGTTVIVNGGNFGPASTRSEYTTGIMGDGTVVIKGGTFGFDPSAWVAEGYEAVKDGSTWTVSAK